MKSTLKLLVAAAVFSAASIANAVSIPSSGEVAIEETPYRANYGGGEFKATVDGFDPFYTFCVERFQDLSGLLPDTFDYQLASSTSSTGNVMSVGTTYLFKKFTAGSLYNLTDLVSRVDNSAALQVAIWVLEGEGAGLPGIGTNIFLDLVYGQFGIAGATADSDDVTVKVMRIIGENGEDLQDVLVYVPDSGATLALLGLALSAFAISRRRR